MGNEGDGVMVGEEALRWLERELEGCGQGVRFGGEVVLSGAERVTIGDNVHVGAGAFIRGEGGLEIGENTHISRNVVIYTVNHRYEGERLPYDDVLVAGRVVIGRNVWIGMNVCVVPGTVIGDGAIVGMGCVVSGTVPAGAIVGSARWRVLGWRDPMRYIKLEEAGAYGGAGGVALGEAGDGD